MDSEELAGRFCTLALMPPDDKEFDHEVTFLIEFPAPSLGRDKGITEICGKVPLPLTRPPTSPEPKDRSPETSGPPPSD